MFPFVIYSFFLRGYDTLRTSKLYFAYMPTNADMLNRFCEENIPNGLRVSLEVWN